MTRLLAPGVRCTAYWFAQQARLLTGNGDLEFLRELGLAAWHIGWFERGLEVLKVPEGPYLVCLWPEEVWDAAAGRMAQTGAEHGDYATVPGVAPAGRLEQWQSQPAPPGDSFWSCQPPPEGTMAYDDWTRMADSGRESPYG